MNSYYRHDHEIEQNNLSGKQVSVTRRLVYSSSFVQPSIYFQTFFARSTQVTDFISNTSHTFSFRCKTSPSTLHYHDSLVSSILTRSCRVQWLASLSSPFFLMSSNSLSGSSLVVKRHIYPLQRNKSSTNSYPLVHPSHPTENKRPGSAPALTPAKTKCVAAGLLSPLISALQSAGQTYSSSLITRPILTKALTAGFTFFLSDYTAQQIEKPPSTSTGTGRTHDWVRTFVSCAVGLFYFGPAAHAWYEWIFGFLPGTSLVSTLQKAALGQLLFGPSFTCIFFAASLMQAGKFSFGNWLVKIKRDLPGAWISGAGFWTSVDLISYSLVPVKFIPLFINVCSFVWTIYLSMVANRAVQKKK